MQNFTNYIILIAHPNPGSSCANIAQAVHNGLSSRGTATTINLYQESFEPILQLEELRRKFSFEPMVLHHQDLLKSANHILMFFPLWWNGYPAILKGWLDRIMCAEFAYTYTAENNIEGLLKDKYLTMNITHSEPIEENDSVFLRNYFAGTLKDTGITTQTIHFTKVQRRLGNTRINAIAQSIIDTL